jgi:hypothetical protein
MPTFLSGNFGGRALRVGQALAPITTVDKVNFTTIDYFSSGGYRKEHFLANFSFEEHIVNFGFLKSFQKSSKFFDVDDSVIISINPTQKTDYFLIVGNEAHFGDKFFQIFVIEIVCPFFFRDVSFDDIDHFLGINFEKIQPIFFKKHVFEHLHLVTYDFGQIDLSIHCQIFISFYGVHFSLGHKGP